MIPEWLYTIIIFFKKYNTIIYFGGAMKQKKFFLKRVYAPLICEKQTAYFLCLLGGWVGAHKFYEGKTAQGILYLLTFGLLGLGWIVDLIAILCRKGDLYFT